MEGWRQERLGPRVRTHREKETNKHLYKKNKRRNIKTHLAHTGLLMEGPSKPSRGEPAKGNAQSH